MVQGKEENRFRVQKTILGFEAIWEVFKPFWGVQLQKDTWETREVPGFWWEFREFRPRSLPNQPQTAGNVET